MAKGKYQKRRKTAETQSTVENLEVASSTESVIENEISISKNKPRYTDYILNGSLFIAFLVFVMAAISFYKTQTAPQGEFGDKTLPPFSEYSLESLPKYNRNILEVKPTFVFNKGAEKKIAVILSYNCAYCAEYIDQHLDMLEQQKTIETSIYIYNGSADKTSYELGGKTVCIADKHPDKFTDFLKEIAKYKGKVVDINISEIFTTLKIDETDCNGGFTDTYTVMSNSLSSGRYGVATPNTIFINAERNMPGNIPTNYFDKIVNEYK